MSGLKKIKAIRGMIEPIRDLAKECDKFSSGMDLSGLDNIKDLCHWKDDTKTMKFGIILSLLYLYTPFIFFIVLSLFYIFSDQIFKSLIKK